MVEASFENIHFLILNVAQHSKGNVTKKENIQFFIKKSRYKYIMHNLIITSFAAKTDSY